MCQQKLLTHVHKNGIMNTSSREKEKSDGTRNQISWYLYLENMGGGVVGTR